MKRLLASLALGLILPSFVRLAAAQSLTTGAISGTVVDQSGAVMASVVVTAKNVDTGAMRETQTTGSGNFLLAQLDPGRYTVTAECSGFSDDSIKLYGGAPGVFMLFTPDRVLLNTCTYAAEAFKTFLEGMRTQNREDIYSQYVTKHFERSWFAVNAVPLSEVWRGASSR